MTRRGLAALAAAAVSLAACGSAPPVPDDHFYRLVGGRSFAWGETVFGGALELAPVTAVGVRRDRPLIFSRPPHVSFRQYHYHHWEEPPPALVKRRLLAALEQAGVAKTVVARPLPEAAARLEVEVQRFDRLVEGSEVAVVVALAVTLREGGRSAPALRSTYQARRAAAPDSMDDTARAFSAALDAVLVDLLADLRAR